MSMISAYPLAGGRYTLLDPLPGQPDMFSGIDHAAFGRPVHLRRYPGAAAPGADLGEQRRFLRWVAEQAGLRHPLAPQLYEYLRAGDDIYLVLEPVTGVPLAAVDLDMDGLLDLAIQLCTLLEQLHHQNPPHAHGRIAPEHLLRDAESGAVRLASLSARQGEPADDLRDLATTLLALAPSPPPSTLADTLADALADDPAARPAAVALRERLEHLRASVQLQALLAPDGTPLADLPALAAWAARNWVAAAAWLYGEMPDQIATWWRRPALAAALRQITAAHTDMPTGLALALPLLDPRLAGTPDVRASTSLVDLGTFAAGSLRTRTIELVNHGALPAFAEVRPPPWLSATPQRLPLTPGERASITLSTRDTLAGVGRWQEERVWIDLAGGSHTALSVRARVGRWRSAWRSNPLLMLVMCALTLWLAWMFSVAAYASTMRQFAYQQGRAALTRGEWATARAQFERARTFTSASGPTDSDLLTGIIESVEPELAALLAAGELTQARALLERVVGAAPDPSLDDFYSMNKLWQMVIEAENQRTGESVRRRQLLGLSADVRLLALHPNGETALFSARPSSVELWSLQKSRPFGAYDLQSYRIVAGVFSADGAPLVVSSSYLGTIVSRPVRKADQWKLPDGADNVTVSADGAYIAYQLGDELVIATVTTRMQPLTRVAQGRVADMLAISNDGTRLAALERTRLVLYDGRNSGEQRALALSAIGLPNDAAVRALHFAPTGEQLALLTRDELWLIDLSGGDMKGQLLLRHPDATLRGPAFSPDGRRLAVAAGREVWVYDRTVADAARRYTAHAQSILGLAFIKGSAQIMSVDTIGVVQVWQLRP